MPIPRQELYPPIPDFNSEAVHRRICCLSDQDCHRRRGPGDDDAAPNDFKSIPSIVLPVVVSRAKTPPHARSCLDRHTDHFHPTITLAMTVSFNLHGALVAETKGCIEDNLVLGVVGGAIGMLCQSNKQRVIPRTTTVIPPDKLSYVSANGHTAFDNCRGVLGMKRRAHAVVQWLILDANSACPMLNNHPLLDADTRGYDSCASPALAHSSVKVNYIACRLDFSVVSSNNCNILFD
jgi:hypothetical protein